MLKLKTAILQDMVAKAVKGASNNRMIPLTGLIALEFSEGILTLTTTDATNTLRIVEKGLEGENFYVAVQAETFSKLVAKTTSEHITLSLNENFLEFKGNGVYSIDLPLDEDGGLIRFPNITEFEDADDKGYITLSTVKSILATNKAAVAVTMETPSLTGYYFKGDTVITTDAFKVCFNNVGNTTFTDDVLLPAELVDLLALMDEENIAILRKGNKILFETEKVRVQGSILECIDEYPIEPIENYINESFASICKLPKAPLLKILDRLELFVSAYDRNGVYLTFDDNKLLISNMRNNGTEIIEYQSCEGHKPFTCCIDVELLKSQLAAQTEDVVELWYGHKTAIKITTKKITQVIALLEDERATKKNGKADS